MELERLVFAIPAAVVVLLPFVLVRRQPWSTETTPERFRELQRGYERCLRAIKDLQFEHQMGSLSADEHVQLRAEYKERAIALRRALERARLAAVRRIATGQRTAASGEEKKRLEALVRAARAASESPPAEASQRPAE